MTDLDGPRAGPASGVTRQLVVLLHGYGADGADLIGLSEPMATYLPDAVFLAPNGPAPCRINPMGRQWFPISQIDGSPEAEMRAGYIAAAEALDGWLETAITHAGVARSATALVGFSQGTMMALSVGPRRPPGLAGIVGFSGRLIDPAALSLAQARPPVLLIHGDRDDVVPHSAMAEAEAELKGAGFTVATHTSAGTGHGIAPDGLGLATGFLRSAFGLGPVG
ncbi:MAG: alpha/beta hydrolase [Pikeienuella sp.]